MDFDIIKPPHNKVVGGLGLIAILLGSFANIKQYGYSSALLFIIAAVIALYVLLSEISCVLSGKCYITAIINTLISVGIFGTIIYYYGNILLQGGGLPSVSEQPISKVDKSVIPISGIIQEEVKKTMDTIKINRVE